MLSPFPSSHLSFLPLQSVLYFSVSSSVCPNSQWCFPTFSLSRNTLWRHSLNFPLWFLYCISSEIRFSAIFSWSSLLKSPWEPSILEVGREGAAFPDVLSSLFSPCHPLASLPPPHQCSQKSIFTDRPTHLLPRQDLAAPLPCLWLPCFMCLSPRLVLVLQLSFPSAAWNPPSLFSSHVCLAMPFKASLLATATFTGAGVSSSMALYLLSSWSHGAALFLCRYALHAFCMAVAFLITKVTDNPLSAEGPEVPYSPHREPWPDCLLYSDAFLSYRGLLVLLCKSWICGIIKKSHLVSTEPYAPLFQTHRVHLNLKISGCFPKN